MTILKLLASSMMSRRRRFVKKLRSHASPLSKLLKGKEMREVSQLHRLRKSRLDKRGRKEISRKLQKSSSMLLKRKARRKIQQQHNSPQNQQLERT